MSTTSVSELGEMLLAAGAGERVIDLLTEAGRAGLGGGAVDGEADGAGSAAAQMYGTDLPIRDDLIAAHRHVLRRWVSPGSWWTAEQRLSVVRQVRAALDSDPLPPWASPTQLGLAQGADASGEAAALPDAAVDAIWRITNHPGTLTRDWYEGVAADLSDALGVGPEHAVLAYVEMAAVAAQANNLDRFADALGLEQLNLPAPTPGEPSRVSDPDAQVRNHWVPTADLPTPNVLLALSAVPAEVETWLVLSDAGYVPVSWIRRDLVSNHGSLTRPQIELVAARTSKLNECFY